MEKKKLIIQVKREEAIELISEVIWQYSTYVTPDELFEYEDYLALYTRKNMKSIVDEIDEKENEMLMSDDETIQRELLEYIASSQIFTEYELPGDLEQLISNIQLSLIDTTGKEELICVEDIHYYIDEDEDVEIDIELS
jgi:hypothetical protein